MTSLGCRDFDLHEFVILARCYHQVPGVKMSLIFVTGEITLVAMGPLTNLALAYRLDDSFSSKLHKLVIMGGNTEGNLQYCSMNQCTI